MTEVGWLAREDPERMLTYVRITASDRKLRLYAVACCRLLWPWLTDECSRDAVRTAEAFADGLADVRALAAARAAMNPGFRNRHTASLREATLAQTGDRREAAAVSARWKASWDAARKAVRADASDAARSAFLASCGALSCAGKGAAPAAEGPPQDRLCRLLIDFFGNPFRPEAFDAAWRTPDVASLAAAAYEERDPKKHGELDASRLCVLADALEEAAGGEGLVAHLRSEGPHVQGCWALDLTLGRS